MIKADFSDSSADASNLSSTDARDRLQSATRLSFLHWLIIALSLVLSVAAWRYSTSSHHSQIEARFDRESAQVIELVKHRMDDYADTLWGGVGMIQANGGEVGFDQWKMYADSIQIGEKYPGINGIGVIHQVHEEEMPEYLARQRKDQPDFQVHPRHDSDEYFPIGYIVPVKGNEKAVGLDIAHETNRRSAAKKSRDTGRSQITGPIILVQDNNKTPGFLFYAPFYDGGTYQNLDDRRDHFSGLVYAPFVVKKLMEGVLEKDRRQVGIRLTDGDRVLYDEHVASDPDFDPDPQFKHSAKVSLYGRTWEFDVWSKNSFRTASHSSQPLLILLGGFLIDTLVFVLFVSITRSSRKALNYADAMLHQFEQSNADLEQFASIASHDLQEPLRKVTSFCGLLGEEYGDKLDADGKRYIEFAIDGAIRMRGLIHDLLMFSKIGSEQNQIIWINTEQALSLAILDLGEVIEESSAEITHDPLPPLMAREREIAQLFQNLIENAIKYKADRTPKIHVSVSSHPKQWQFSIVDNGIGIAPEFQERVFGVFKRLHSRKELSGTGIGLAICKRIVDRMGGRIWFETKADPGCKVCFTLPKQKVNHTTIIPNRHFERPSNEHVSVVRPG